MAKKALITGITGQDGSYLAEFLLAKGYEVHGIIRRASTFNTGRLEPIYSDPHAGKSRLFLHYGDLSDASALSRLLATIQPEELYNLAAQSHVRVSFDSPEYTTDITATGAVRLLEAIRQAGLRPRFYQASSSEMYGMIRETPQTEQTPFYPRSPYGCAKVYAPIWITVQAMKSHYDMPRQQRHSFQPRVSLCQRQRLSPAKDHPRCRSYQGRSPEQALPWQPRRQTRLGLCQGIRRSDVAHAPAGQARWIYVVATNETHSVQRVPRTGVMGTWVSRGKKAMSRLIRAIIAPAEVGLPHRRLQGQSQTPFSSWEPKTKFADLVKLMVDADVKLLQGPPRGRIQVVG